MKLLLSWVDLICALEDGIRPSMLFLTIRKTQANGFGLVSPRVCGKSFSSCGSLGKDYVNERVVEFHALTKPDEDLHDRSKVPRMPW